MTLFFFFTSIIFFFSKITFKLLITQKQEQSNFCSSHKTYYVISTYNRGSNRSCWLPSSNKKPCPHSTILLDDASRVSQQSVSPQFCNSVLSLHRPLQDATSEAVLFLLPFFLFFFIVETISARALRRFTRFQVPLPLSLGHFATQPNTTWIPGIIRRRRNYLSATYTEDRRSLA